MTARLQEKEHRTRATVVEHSPPVDPMADAEWRLREALGAFLSAPSRDRFDQLCLESERFIVLEEQLTSTAPSSGSADVALIEELIGNHRRLVSVLDLVLGGVPGSTKQHEDIIELRHIFLAQVEVVRHVLLRDSRTTSTARSSGRDRVDHATGVGASPNTDTAPSAERRDHGPSRHDRYRHLSTTPLHPVTQSHGLQPTANRGQTAFTG